MPLLQARAVNERVFLILGLGHRSVPIGGFQNAFGTPGVVYSSHDAVHTDRGKNSQIRWRRQILRYDCLPNRVPDIEQKSIPFK